MADAAGDGRPGRRQAGLAIFRKTGVSPVGSIPLAVDDLFGPTQMVFTGLGRLEVALELDGTSVKRARLTLGGSAILSASLGRSTRRSR